MKNFTRLIFRNKQNISNCIPSNTFFLFLFFLLIGSLKTDAQSNHTVTFSGNASDFNSAEKYAAAANNTDYYVTFDASNVYIGAFRTAGNTFGGSDNLAIYIDTDPNSSPTSGTGTTTGQSYNSVSGSLPFSANYNVHVEQGFKRRAALPVVGLAPSVDLVIGLLQLLGKLLFLLVALVVLILYI